MRIYNERPIAKVKPGLAADSVFIFLSLMGWASFFIAANLLMHWLAHDFT